MMTSLRERRARIGMTQQDLAEQLGVSHEMVSRWERGVNGVKMEIIQQLADVFGMDPAALAGEIYRTWEERHTR